jgi:hypothetical protein
MNAIGLDDPVDEIMDKLSIGDVYRLAHNYEHGARSVVADPKAMRLFYPASPPPPRHRWGHNFTDEQKAVQSCLERVVAWMKNHPVETERFIIERSPSCAADLATKSGFRNPERFHPDNERRFFEKCAEKPRFNLACVKYCDHYGLFAPNMDMIMFAAGYGDKHQFRSYIKKMQGLKKHTAQLIEDFLKFKSMDEAVSVKQLVEELRT